MNRPPHPGSLPRFARYEVVAEDDPATEQVDPIESASLSPSAVTARREQFRMGRTAARLALRAAGLAFGPIPIGEDRAPVWPAGVAGSITHTDGLAAALVAPRSLTDGVGLDLERRRDVPEIEDQVVTPQERLWLERLDENKRPDALLEVFSVKETIYKALAPSVGRFFGFDAATVEPSSGGYRARLLDSVDRRYPAARAFSVGVEWDADVVLTWTILPKTREI